MKGIPHTWPYYTKYTVLNGPLLTCLFTETVQPLNSQCNTITCQYCAMPRIACLHVRDCNHVRMQFGGWHNNSLHKYVHMYNLPLKCFLNESICFVNAITHSSGNAMTSVNQMLSVLTAMMQEVVQREHIYLTISSVTVFILNYLYMWWPLPTHEKEGDMRFSLLCGWYGAHT